MKVAEEREAAPSRVVHRLHMLATVCDLSETYAMPGYWPEGHLFSNSHTEVTCTGCLNGGGPHSRTQREIRDKGRPGCYEAMNPIDQWLWDRKLGLLDSLLGEPPAPVFAWRTRVQLMVDAYPGDAKAREDFRRQLVQLIADVELKHRRRHR